MHKKLYLENGMLFIHGSGRIAMPEYQDAAFSYNDECISIRAKNEQEGRCQVTLVSLDEVEIGRPADLVHRIRAKNGQVIITLVAGDPVMTLLVSADTACLSIWLNDPNEADRIIVGAGPG